jgi:hypothetical protein
MFVYDETVLNCITFAYTVGIWMLTEYIKYVGKKSGFVRVDRLNPFASNIISMCNVYCYILFRNDQIMLAYYMYDLVNSISKRDTKIVIHHLISGWFLCLAVDHPDKYNIRLTAWYFEFSNQFMYYYKITKYSTLSKPIKLLIGWLSLNTTIIMWVVFRIGYLLYVINWPVTQPVKVSFWIFMFANIAWIRAMLGTVRQLER